MTTLTLHHGDCLVVMAAIPDKLYDTGTPSYGEQAVARLSKHFV